MDAVEILAPGRYVTLSVSDTGCGMNQETVIKIFEPYLTTKEIGKGTGLGLAVVHGIVHDHHGAIEVSSEPGRGTIFNVHLPMILQDAISADIEVEPPVSIAHERVMLVDDESALLNLAHQVLTKAGYRVEAFANGTEAWDAISLRPNDWDILVTDQTMPKMTGEQLAVKVQEIRPDLPIIICSGYGTLQDGDQIKKGQITAFLQKPISWDILLTQVAKALTGK